LAVDPTTTGGNTNIEAFIRTDERTMLSYLLKPLTDQARRAFREM
jgi:HlyD family secretion protein